MNASSRLLMVPFREVRHFQPDDCLHYEPLEVRGRLHAWTIPAHRHEDLYQFELLERGAVVATIDGAQYDLRAPAAWMSSPGSVHGFVYRRGSRGHKVTVPSAALLTPLAPSPKLAGQLRAPIVLRKQDLGAAVTECRRLLDPLIHEFSARRPGRSEALQAHAVLLALWFLRYRNPSAPARTTGLRDTLVQRYRALLDANFRRHLPVRFYADRLQVTPDHLSRVCRALTGLGALEVMHERVVLEARRLLAYTDSTVIDIAQTVGFADPGHFSRFFAKGVGQSPSAYRASLSSGLAVLPERGDGLRALAAARGATRDVH